LTSRPAREDRMGPCPVARVCTRGQTTGTGQVRLPFLPRCATPPSHGHHDSSLPRSTGPCGPIRPDGCLSRRGTGGFRRQSFGGVAVSRTRWNSSGTMPGSAHGTQRKSLQALSPQSAMSGVPGLPAAQAERWSAGPGVREVRRTWVGSPACVSQDHQERLVFGSRRPEPRPVRSARSRG